MSLAEGLTRAGLLWWDGCVVLGLALWQAGPFVVALGGVAALLALTAGWSPRRRRARAAETAPPRFTLR